MNQEYSKEIEKIIGGMQCPKDFKCCKPGVDVLCKAKNVGMESVLLVCLEENPPQCKFVNIERGYICECPLRIYIAKKLEK